MTSYWKQRVRRGLFSLVTPFSAAARKAFSRTEARDTFEMAKEYGASPMGGVLLKTTTVFLEEAGEDLSTDKPYKEILGLEGGKAAFDDMVQKTQEETQKRDEAYREKMKNKKPGKPQA